MSVTEPFRVTRRGDDPWVVLADATMTGGAVSFGEARIPPRTAGPSLHQHRNEDEAAYVVDGAVTFRVGDETFEAGPGTLVWLPRGVPHTFANRSDAPAWVFGTISPAGLEGMFAEQAAYFASLTGPPDEERIDEIGARWGVTRMGPPLDPGPQPHDQPRPWLPPAFRHPTYVPLPSGYHLRPIREADVDLDMIAVMGSRSRLWDTYGRAWGWPPADLTTEQDRADLARHAAEMETHESFNYALFDTDETALLGCVYIDPPEKPGADAEISWWVVDECLGTDLEAELDAFVPRWVAEEWPLRSPRYVGRDLTWDEWSALPDVP